MTVFDRPYYHDRHRTTTFGAARPTLSPFRETPLELPNSHRVPLYWLMEVGGAPTRYRVLSDLAPEGTVRAEDLARTHQAVEASPLSMAVVRKQKDNGVWAGNMLGLAPDAGKGIKGVGTIAQYRRLVQLAYPRHSRPFKLADRILYRLLSRDPDPALLFEYRKTVEREPATEVWVRAFIREGATAALAEGGHNGDPRVRGSAHKIASEVSQFLRSPLAEKPFIKVGAQTVLDPEAHPPTWYSVAMIAAMPNLQRERAGFTDRLGHFLAQPAPKKAFVVKTGRKSIKAEHFLLGDPIEADRNGKPKDIPLALHYIELLARIGALHTAPVATKVLVHLLKDCDERGVWCPRNLRSQPKPGNKAAYHYYPIEPDRKTLECREVDVTFRLALIAKLLGWQLDYDRP